MTTRLARFLLPAAACLALGAAAGPAAAAPTATPVVIPPPPAGKGEVVFFRKPLFSLIPFNWHVHENDAPVCPMEAGAYCVAVVDPGTHNYEVHTEAHSRLTLEVDAGEVYYVIGGISMGVVVNRPTIAPADKAQFDAISAKLKQIPQSQPGQPTS